MIILKNEFFSYEKKMEFSCEGLFRRNFLA